MTLPQPTVDLTDVCAVMFNNTLYTYSADAFQSLEFASGADWKQLPSGESVTGGVCVSSTPGDSTQAGFYVIGGTSSTSNYTGLQKFTYATGEWEAITPQSLVTQDRLYHAAVYINDTDTILMYAGSQDGSTGESTQTFTIEASSPYNVLAYQSIAPPTKNPILLQWSSSEAVLVGGSTTNTKVMLFNPATGGWKDSGTTLATGLSKDISSMQAALMTGDDGSKNLYTLDMSVSPNEVGRIVLMDGSGQPVTSSAPAKRALLDESSAAGRQWNDMRTRADAESLTLSDWPTYNSSLAPTVTRTGFSIAEGSDGTIVAAGGGGSDVLCVFNGRENTWRNASQIFAATRKNAIVTSSSASASSTPTTLVIAATPTTSQSSEATSAASTTAAAAALTSHGTSTGTIIGAVVGSISGLGIIILIAFFLILRRRKQKGQKDAAYNRHLSEGGSSEKDAYDIINGNSMPRPIGGGGKGVFRGSHQAQESQASVSSVAILMGRVNQPRPVVTIQQNNGRERKRSSSDSVFKAFKSTISKPIPRAVEEQSMGATAIPQQAQFERSDPSLYGGSTVQPRPLDDQALQPDSTRRSSGWNRYWSGGSALNIIGFGNGSGNGAGNTGSNVNMQNAGSSKRTTVVSDVSSHYSMADRSAVQARQDSAMVTPLAIPVMPESKPRFQRVNSGSPTVSSFNNYLANGMQGKIERSISQSSSRSGYSSGIPASVHDTWDPTGYNDKPWGTDRAPSSAYSTPLAPASGPGSKKSYVPTGMSRQPQLARANTSSDMSWLNLGEVSRV